jgi:hypothetical protein
MLYPLIQTLNNLSFNIPDFDVGALVKDLRSSWKYLIDLADSFVIKAIAERYSTEKENMFGIGFCVQACTTCQVKGRGTEAWNIQFFRCPNTIWRGLN